MTAPAPLDLAALLDDLERAHAAATPGPWKFCEVSDGWDGKTLALETIAKEPPHADGSVSPVGYVLSGWGYDASGIDVSDEDAALIVAAVNHLPTLIAALRAVAELAEQFEAEAEVREVRATTYPPSGPWAIDHNRLVVRADTFRRSAARIRSTLTAALSPESVTT